MYRPCLTWGRGPSASRSSELGPTGDTVRSGMLARHMIGYDLSLSPHTPTESFYCQPRAEDLGMAANLHEPILQA